MPIVLYNLTSIHWIMDDIRLDMGTREQYVKNRAIILMIRLQVYEGTEKRKKEGLPRNKQNSSRHGELGLQFFEFRLIGLLICRFARFHAARTHGGVHWYMICAHESLVESVLFELLQLCFEFILRAGVCGDALAPPPTSEQENCVPRQARDQR